MLVSHCVLQVQNGILLPSLQPALPFLDLHGVQRLEFHQSVLDEIRVRLLNRIQILAASNDKNKLKVLNDILIKSFPVIKVSAGWVYGSDLQIHMGVGCSTDGRALC